NYLPAHDRSHLGKGEEVHRNILRPNGQTVFDEFTDRRGLLANRLLEFGDPRRAPPLGSLVLEQQRHALQAQKMCNTACALNLGVKLGPGLRNRGGGSCGVQHFTRHGLPRGAPPRFFSRGWEEGRMQNSCLQRWQRTVRLNSRSSNWYLKPQLGQRR